VLWSDGTPAAGIASKLYGRFRRSAVTDALGVLTFADVDTGRFGVLFPMNGYAVGTGEVRAGEETAITVRIPLGVQVNGRVIDRSGNPVENAEIYVGMNDSDGSWVARTDAAGDFHLRDVGPDWFKIAARAAGHAPSAISRIGKQPGETTSMTLELGGPGGSVSGTVVDGEGDPIAGATVLLVPNQGFGTARGTDQELPPAQEMVADERGAFSFAGATSGTNTILAKAQGYAPWRGPVEVVAGGAASVEVWLSPQCVCTGVVRAADGTPASGADVGIRWEPEGERRFDRTSLTCGSDGSFRIDSLPPGEFVLRSSKARLGTGSSSVVLRPGEESSVDLLLDPGLTLRGRVVSEQGDPVAGVTVNAQFAPPAGSSDREPRSKNDRTDSEGRFAITNCDAELCKLGVYDPNVPYEVSLIALLPEVRIDGSEITISLDASVRPLSFVAGFVQDADGQPAPLRVGVRAAEGDVEAQAKVDPSSGRFEAGPFPPGSYTVEIQRAPVGLYRKIACELHQGERVDLGTLHLPACGRLRLILQNRESIPGTLTIRLRHSAAAWGTVDFAESDWPQALDLLPGTYSCEVMGARLIAQRQSFTVAAGSETVVTMALVRACMQTLSFTLDPDDGGSVWVGAEIFDAGGQRVADASTTRWAGLTAKVMLLPGSYVIRARTSSFDEVPPDRPTYAGEQSIVVGEQDEEREWRTVLRPRAR
jgi:uncharacterized GH25 family protein